MVLMDDIAQLQSRGCRGHDPATGLAAVLGVRKTKSNKNSNSKEL